MRIIFLILCLNLTMYPMEHDKNKPLTKKEQHRVDQFFARKNRNDLIIAASSAALFVCAFWLLTQPDNEKNV